MQRFWQLYRASSYQLIAMEPQKLPTDAFLRFPDGTELDEQRALGYLAPLDLSLSKPFSFRFLKERQRLLRGACDFTFTEPGQELSLEAFGPNA